MDDNTPSDNSKQSENNNNEQKLDVFNQTDINIFVIISGLALCVWLIPGIAIISHYLAPVVVPPNPNPSSPDNSITYEQAVKIVDSQTQETYGLINILLFVLTALPIAGNYYFWLLYKSVRHGMMEDATQGVEGKINQRVDKELNIKIPEYIKDERLTDELTEILKNQPTILENSIVNSQGIKNMLEKEINEMLAKIQTIVQTNSINDDLKSSITGIETNVKEIQEIKNIVSNQSQKLEYCQEVTNSQSKIQESITKIEESINLLKQANYYFDLGMKHFVQGNYSEAIKEYENATTQDQKYDLAWYYKGEAYREIGNDNKDENSKEEAFKNYCSAINAYNAITKNSELHRAFYNKAICHALVEQNSLAIDSLREAIKLNPKYKQKAMKYHAFDSIKTSNNFYETACFYALGDKKEEALDSLKKALTTEDENQKSEIKEKVTKQTDFDNIKNDENYKTRFDQLINKEEELKNSDIKLDPA
jgi:tetratricopeptide (TPR) repeat protein